MGAAICDNACNRMKTKAFLGIAAVLFSLCGLSSCVRWSIGEKLLTADEKRVGWDYRHPVDNQLYCLTHPDGSRQYYARLREVRYQKETRLVVWYEGALSRYRISKEAPTGRMTLAELALSAPHASNKPEAGEPQPLCLVRCLKEVPSLPAGAVPLPPGQYAVLPQGMMEDGRLEADSAPGAFRRAMASTISYTLDPALTIVSSAAATAVYVPWIAVLLPVIDFQIQQEAWRKDDEAVSTSDTAPATPAKSHP